MDQAPFQIDFPKAFEAAMREQLPADYDRFAQAHQAPAPVSIRLNPRKQVLDIGSPVPWATHGRYLPARPSFITDPLWHAGAYYVQEASSMFLEQAINAIGPQTISRVLDLCSAPGGKSTHLLAMMRPDVTVVSNEVIRSRAATLVENLQRWGYPNVIVTNNDPFHFAKLPALFDLVLVDAPCSGEGLFRKDPEAKLEWSEAHAGLCAARQARILEDVWPALSKGGHLIFCTCTYNAAENEMNLDSFCRNHPAEFVPIPLNSNWQVETVKHGRVVGYRFYPHRVAGEGFFLSVLKKTDGESLVSSVKSHGRKLPTPTLLKQVADWFLPNANLEIETLNDTLFALPDADLLSHLRKHLKIVTAGTAMATVKRDKLVPESALAFSSFLNANAFPQIELSLPQAIQYLKKETLSLETDLKGFALATYKNLGLGWMNLLPNRINNLYPSSWRILK